MSETWIGLPTTPRRGRPLSIEEWLGLDEEESGELVDGHLEEEEVPDYVHEVVVAFLLTLLNNWLGEDGFAVGSEIKLALPSGRGRKADLTVHLPGSASRPPPRGPLRTAPDIVIEVVTPTPRDERRDRVEKRLDYARFGVRWYWLVDPALGSFEILELDPRGKYAVVETATAGVLGVLESIPGCAGLRIDVDALWRRVSRLSE